MSLFSETLPERYHRRVPSSALVSLCIGAALALGLTGIVAAPVSSQGVIWITTEDEACEYDATGSMMDSFPLTTISGRATGMDQDGFGLWVLSESPDEVSVVWFDGTEAESFALSGIIGQPTGLARTRESVWICTESGMVYEYVDGAQVGSFAATGGGIPVGIAASDSSAAIWVATESGFLTAYTPSGAHMEQLYIAGVCANPSGLDLSADAGTFIVVDDSQNAIHRINTSGQVEETTYINGCTGATSVGGLFSVAGIAESPPLRAGQLLNYPNPFGPQTSVRFILDQRSYVEVGVYSAAGQLVKPLFSGVREPGVYNDVLWDGSDSRGERVSAGVYFCRLVTRSGVDARRVILMR